MPSDSLESAPAPWPLQYTSDMDRGFKTMARIGKTKTVPERFMEAFDTTTFPHTTYYNHVGYWKALTSAQIHDGLTQGKTPYGEWAYILKKYGLGACGKGKEKAAAI